MSKSSKSRVVYIEASPLAENPRYTLAQLAADVAHTAHLDDMLTHYVGVNNRPAPGRRKVKISITVEDAE